jgi:hypothetical protein
MVIAPAALMAQFSSTSSSLMAYDVSRNEGAVQPVPSIQNAPDSYGPFSRIAIGGTISPLGPGVEVTANVNNHLNIRGVGNVFNYSTNFSTNGFTANAKLNLTSARITADIFPFRAGFRISPGLMFFNGNKLTASSTVAGGTSFTLNGDAFYSANANSETGAAPLAATAALGLNTTKPAFTITAGWGNTIPRRGGHWSFPFEVGVALTGAPSLNANLTGWACYDQAQTECTNVASTTDPLALEIQSDLTAQLASWKNDLEPLKTYPIVSFGVAYSFGVRGNGVK